MWRTLYTLTASKGGNYWQMTSWLMFPKTFISKLFPQESCVLAVFIDNKGTPWDKEKLLTVKHGGGLIMLRGWFTVRQTVCCWNYSKMHCPFQRNVLDVRFWRLPTGWRPEIETQQCKRTIKKKKMCYKLTNAESAIICLYKNASHKPKRA